MGNNDHNLAKVILKMLTVWHVRFQGIWYKDSFVRLIGFQYDAHHACVCTHCGVQHVHVLGLWEDQNQQML